MLPFIEKYRPNEFKDVAGIDTVVFSKYISNIGEMPNLFLYGPAGCGKTTISKIIINKLQPIDVLYVNGSDTTSVDYIRDKVYNFISSKSREENKPKIVFIDECDYLSQSAWAALRGLMEKFIKNSRFICTSNTLLQRLGKELQEAILSRFTLHKFEHLKPEDIFVRIKTVCELEQIKVDDECLMEIAKNSKGDIRNSLNNIQKLSANNEIKKEDISSMSYNTKDIYDIIISKNWSKLRKDIVNMNLEYELLITDLSDLFFESDLPLVSKIKINELLAQGMVDLNFSFNKDICFTATVSKIMGQLP
jgi:DNA polymerase III delta prime subunit